MSRLDSIGLVVVLAAVASMPFHALIARSRDADVARRPTTILLGAWVRDWLMWLIGPLERLLVRLGARPLLFNLLGAAFGLAAGIAFARGALSAGGWLVLLGGLSDVIDGRLARALKMVSRSGAFLDSTLDRFAEMFAFAGLAVYFAGSPRRVMVVALALGASLLVSYTRARGQALGVECHGGIMQRAERLVLLALAALFDAGFAAWTHRAPGTLLAAALTLIAAGSIATAIYRTRVIARALVRDGAKPG